MTQIFDIFLLEAILNGVLFGGLLALLSVGLNLVFGVMEVVWTRHHPAHEREPRFRWPEVHSRSTA